MSNIRYRYDVEGLAGELEIELKDVVELFSIYFEEMENEISEMRTLLARQDWHLLERVVHNVKGVSANLGIHDVFEEAQKFGDHLKKKHPENMDAHMDNIVRLIYNAEREIKSFFEEKGLSLRTEHRL